MTMPRIDRRQFLQVSAGLVVGVAVAPRLARAIGARPPVRPNAFVHIGTDDTVTIRIAHSEMGQGIWTTLPMLVAEELGCDWSTIRVEHAPAAQVYAHTAFHMQMTGGSTTTWSEIDRYREAGAMARQLLVRAAAAEWHVDPADCRVENGHVVAGARKLSFGKLAEAAQKLPPGGPLALKDPKDWTILGKPMKRLDSPEKVTGRAQYGMDVRLPGQLTALVARAPVFGATVKRFHAGRAQAVPGVKKVVQVPSGVAVVAEHFWAAKLGRDALEIDWDLGPGASLDSDRMQVEFLTLAGQPGTRAAGAGDVDAGLKGAATTVEADYSFPYLAHAPMEPLSVTVRLGAGACEIWTGTQFQTLDQKVAAEIAGLRAEQVKLHTMFLGGGFGRRATPTADFVGEAVQVAKAAGGGAPIHVVWTREDDIRGGWYRPLWVHRVRAGLGPDGAPVAWRQTIVGQSILDGTPFAPMMIKDGVDGTSVEGAANSPYLQAIANHSVELHSPRTPIPVLWWRSVGNTHTAYVMETFVDELAYAAKQDPVAYRRKLLQASPRHAGVLELAAEKAGWGKPLPAGRHRGVAVHESFGSWVAQVAEVSVEAGRPRVHRVVCAVDCGVCINPAGVRAQMESGIAFGLSAALHAELTLKGGRVQQSNFHDYPVLRLAEMPEVEVHIVPSREKAGGIGEVAVPPIAPAVANALFAATGKRLRKLPFVLAALLLGLAAGPARAAEGPFETVRAVLQHPRCQNCHIPGDAPLQLDEGRPHALGVLRGPDGKGAPGLPCSTCHAAANPPESYGAHMPPGAPDWQLPPPDRRMVFIGLGAAALCQSLKDGRMNGGRSLAELLGHLDTPLVRWGWSPGVGRKPVPVPYDDFIARFKEWMAAGAPCPK
jgi:isoquinoline 1-oxidoreductase beta subunit